MVRTPGPPNPGRTVPPLTTLAKTAPDPVSSPPKIRTPVGAGADRVAPAPTLVLPAGCTRPPLNWTLPNGTSTTPVLVTGTANTELPGGTSLRSVPALLNTAVTGKNADTWAESGSRNVPAARLFQTAALANWSEVPSANVVVPELFTVRPSSFEKNPFTVVVPFRFVTPGPDIVPPQVSGPETVTVPGPLRVPERRLSAPTWKEAAALAVTVPPVTWS